ncbi:hypothetical protein ROLI_045330 (plasmid) [Roseobacter fucihabitans]|uniref:Polysaccharide pyruvyl transferase domain-containing protein n=1 Tax=Roseobacter fucihabitans TaxID=1537242 RepID=A0ABZ2C1Q5_9RHOB|nr:polysaccharide pyruvyl transferase family protein [Roseobacter litoralis]MBC6967248.1 Polysaccharide pyruvyl transferase [Roseobacter litoralis]
MLNSLIGVLLRLIRVVLNVDHNKVAVLPSASAGSLGDQAMLDSITTQLIQKSAKTPVLIARQSDNISLRNPVTLAIFDAPGVMRKLRAAKQILSCGQMLFIGADVIDGGYGGDCRRLGVLDVAARAGMGCAAVNFSFSEHPGPAAVARLHRLSPVHMYSRDPISLRRFHKVVGREAVQVADVAFLLKPEASSNNAKIAISWAKEQREAGSCVLGVNVGGTTLSMMKGDGLDSIGRSLEGWLSTNPDRAVLLLPHDYKPQPVGDVEALQALLDRLSPQFGNRVHMVQFPFETWDVKAMADVLDFALLARMHFAVACLGMGVPPLCIAYAGKFEGMMQHFGLENMLVSNEEVLDPAVLLARLEVFEAAMPIMKEKINAALPEVKELSKRNFAWL